MDHYGIGNAVASMLRLYCNMSRGSGRTTSLIKSLKDGDRVVFTNQREADRVGKIIKGLGIKVICIVIDPKYPDRMLERGPSDGRTILDHSFVEELYSHAIERCEKQINYYEQQLSEGKDSADVRMLKPKFPDYKP